MQQLQASSTMKAQAQTGAAVMPQQQQQQQQQLQQAAASMYVAPQFSMYPMAYHSVYPPVFMPMHHQQATLLTPQQQQQQQQPPQSGVQQHVRNPPPPFPFTQATKAVMDAKARLLLDSLSKADLLRLLIVMYEHYPNADVARSFKSRHDTVVEEVKRREQEARERDKKEEESVAQRTGIMNLMDDD